ncbi:glycosyltransferase [Microcoleus sp. FACHB-1515]|uniref:glycosyltransferase n=1 Tax=Cyanophyceae TaxID=3028117 RepID=UPI0016841A6B|nr:glycosyltransferase [Microcoleus sp. FACHB-1515]MBD2091734.1 glycosyltransferase [Microcoleus sp. FACHB-1515]
MKRIALISEHASPLGCFGGVDSGGQNVYVGQLAKHLAAIGYSVDVFTRRDRADLPPIVTWQHGVRVVHVPAGAAVPLPKEALLPYMAEFTKFVIEWCQRDTVSEAPSNHYNLIHANFWMSGLVAAEVKRSLQIPFGITFHALGRVRRLHQGTADQFPDERMAIEDRIVREADFIIAECTQDREDLLNLYAADPSRIKIVPCGFDSSEFWPIPQSLARSTLGLPTSDRLILQLGRMVPRKGVETVIRSLRTLRDRHDRTAHLLIVGGESESPDPILTPEIGRLQTVAKAIGVSEQVTFVGQRQREALKYYYSAADVFVTTPWYEPFGITPLEAMACGTPVIGSAVGGVKFTVKDGETGFLIPPRQPDLLAEKLALLFDQPHLQQVMGQQARRRVQTHFTWEQVTSAIAQVYEATLSRSAVRLSQLAATDRIDRQFDAAILAIQQARRSLPGAIAQAADRIHTCFAQGGKLLICGNGGSAADAQHFAAELVGRFSRLNRAGLPAIALTADSAFLTAWSNDIGFEDVFARQVETFAQPQDLLIGISTSGRSPNLIQAFAAAQRLNVDSIALLGGDGGDVLPFATEAIVVPAADTPRIQEVQILVIHLLCDLIETKLASPPPAWEVYEELAQREAIHPLPIAHCPETASSVPLLP